MKVRVFNPVSHQQTEDISEYREFWATHHNGWVLVIPVPAVILIILAVAAVFGG